MPSNPLRHQLASTSPVLGWGLIRAAGAPFHREGRDRERLRTLLRSRHGSAGVVLCGSGTQALTLALHTAERLLGRAVTVGLPAFSCFDVASAAVHLQRPILFYDLELTSLGPDPESLRSVLHQGAEVLVIPSHFGIPIDWGALDPILREHDAFVIEDAAQGHGGSWRGRPLGSHGRLGVLSFSRGKSWTGGSGGALLVRDPDDWGTLAPTLGSAVGALPVPRAGEPRALARAAAHWALGRPGIYGLPRSIPGLGLGETRYHDPRDPEGMPEAAASLLLHSAGAADLEAGTRRHHADQYRAGLTAASAVPVFSVPAESEAGFVRFPCLPPHGIESFRDPALAQRLGAAPSYPLPLPRLPAVRPLLGPTAGDGWPAAAALASRLVTLPTHGLTRASERSILMELLR